jgi:uncharacterized integral membrane protein
VKGLKIIPVFIVLLLCTYVGILFVEANRTPVTVTFGRYQSSSTALGLVVLTAILAGMIIAGTLCSIELIALSMQNRKLRRRISPASRSRSADSSHGEPSDLPPMNEDTQSGHTEPQANDQGRNRFTPM